MFLNVKYDIHSPDCFGPKSICTPFTLNYLPQRILVSNSGVNRTNTSSAVITCMERMQESSVEQKVSSLSVISPWLNFFHWPGCKFL